VKSELRNFVSPPVMPSVLTPHIPFYIIGCSRLSCRQCITCRALTGWRTKCHTIDCARNTFLLLQKHLTSGTELILIGWKIVPNEEHVQCDHRFVISKILEE